MISKSIIVLARISVEIGKSLVDRLHNVPKVMQIRESAVALAVCLNMKIIHRQRALIFLSLLLIGPMSHSLNTAKDSTESMFSTPIPDMRQFHQ